MKQLPFLPKECWLPDSSSNTCYHCEKGFSAIRRKHHCRYCGYIFCSNCSQSKHQLQTGVLVKRICENCLESIVKSQIKPVKINTAYPVFQNKPLIAKYLSEDLEESPEDPDDTEGASLTEEEENAEERAYEVFEELNSDQFSQYNQDAENYLEARVKTLLAENHLNSIWTEHLIQATKNIVTSICPSVHYRKDSMDINNYLRIIKVVNGKIEFRYVKGVVLEKNLAFKKMNREFAFPKMLMLQGNSCFYSEEKKLVSIQQLGEQEDHYSTVLIKKFNHIKPDIVLVEKGMPQVLIRALSQFNISILINVKHKILSLISRISSGEILEHIDHTSWKTNYLGYCSEFFQETIGEKTFAFFLHPDNSYLCGSIIISGPSTAELKQVSKVLRELIVEYRNILLERYVFSQSGMQNIPNIFLELHSAMSTFKHLSISGNKPCSKPSVHNVKYYTANGKALGDYVISMIASPQTRCDSGKVHKLGAHTYYYCKNTGKVKISLHKIETNYNSLMMGKECVRCQKMIIEPEPLSKSAWEYSFNKFINNFFTELPVSHVTSTCLHDFFKSGRFCFMYKFFQVSIEWEDCPMLEIQTIKQSFPSEYFKNITIDSIANLKTHAEYVIKEIFRESKELVVQLSSVTSENIEEIATINEEIMGLGQSITAIKSFLPEMALENFENYLEVENYRRNLFLMCCSMKIQAEKIISHIRKLKHLESPKEKYLNPIKPFTHNEIMTNINNLTESISEEDDLLRSESFSYLRQGFLNLPKGRENLCIPIDENDNFSIISYALNSQEYYDKVIGHISGPDELIEIVECETGPHFSQSFTNFDEVELAEHPLKESVNRLYGAHISVNITLYYAKQFHVIRDFRIGSDKEVILSLSKAENVSTQLGKSKAFFKFSSDRRFITKILDEKRFQMFLEMAPNYFRHIYMSSYHNMPSCLVKTIGAYKVSIKNHTLNRVRCEWVIVSENLGYGMPDDMLIYDLKGTDNQRRKVKEGDSRTKMDLNFLEDFKGIPLAISLEAKRVLDAAIWNDSLFLSKQNIIDYSLLVMISEKQGKIVAGIIDYMEQYTLEKAIESKYKKAVGTELPTITHPNVYRQRFRIQVTQLYFMSLEK